MHPDGVAEAVYTAIPDVLDEFFLTEMCIRDRAKSSASTSPHRPTMYLLPTNCSFVTGSAALYSLNLLA